VKNGFDFGWLSVSGSLLLQGASSTVLLTLISGILGTLLAVAGAAASRSRHGGLKLLVACYVEAIRNTPFLVQLFIIFFALPHLGLKFSPFSAAWLAMMVNLGAYGSEIVAAGLDAVSRGQREAGRALGLGPIVIFAKIVLPQALKIIYPALTSQFVIMLLESAVVSQIAVPELTYQGDMIQARTFRTFETYLVITGIYLGLSLLLRRILKLTGRRLLPGRVA
jgi:polar amino acid transport system permease protein